MASDIFFNILATLEPYKIEDNWIKTVRYYNDIVWLNYSIGGMIPLFILAAYRFFKPLQNEEQYLNAKNYKKQSGFILEKFLTSYGFYYYLLDTLITFIEGSYVEACRFSFLSHHIPSLPLIYFLNQLNYMHWWTLIVAAWHALLITFPDAQLLNYPYLALIFYFHYMIAKKKPSSTVGVYKNVAKVFPFMYLSLIIIWWIDCKNILPYI